MRSVVFLLFSAVIFLTGCSLTPTALPVAEPAAALQGSVHGGQQPVVGAHVYLFAANTTGYGNASVSLLNAASTGHSDSVGAYVLTAGNGTFSISGDYNCTANTQVYVYALGGNPGAGANSAAGFLAALGNCPVAGNFAAATPLIMVNEVSTIAAAYAMAGFAVDATHVSSSGTTLAQADIANAFASAANLATLSTGVALATIPSGNATVPQTTINSLANILAACINSTGPGSSTCSPLFSNAKSAGSSGTAPTDTATAAINIAHNPGANVATLFAITSPSAPFSPALPATPTPNDFTLGLNFNAAPINGPAFIAIDNSGDAWIPMGNNDTLVEISSSGSLVSGSSGYSNGSEGFVSVIAIDESGNLWLADTFNNNVSVFTSAGVPTAFSPLSAGLNYPYSIAIDAAGNAWVVNTSGNNLIEFSPSGAVLSGANGYTGGGISNPQAVAIDASNNAWVINPSAATVTEFSNSGAILSGTTGYPADGYPYAIATDGSGNIWVSSSTGLVDKFSSTGQLLSPQFTGYQGGGLGQAVSIAIDGAGNAWIANGYYNSISELSSTGAPLSPSTGYTGGGINSSQNIAVDGSGNVWIANGGVGTGSVTELIGASVPVVTPIAVGVKNHTLGTRP